MTTLTEHLLTTLLNAGITTTEALTETTGLTAAEFNTLATKKTLTPTDTLTLMSTLGLSLDELAPYTRGIADQPTNGGRHAAKTNGNTNDDTHGDPAADNEETSEADGVDEAAEANTYSTW